MTLLHGQILADPHQSPRPGWIRIVNDRIAEFADGPPPERPDAGHETCLICPGFIDAHTHLPQFGAIGCDGLPLLDWLEQVIYPAEERWADRERARAESASAYLRMLQAGTLGFAGYLSSHAHAWDAATAAALSPPLRAHVGPSLMDRGAPASLLGRGVLCSPGGDAADRMTPSVNPRYAVACTDALLAAAGRCSDGSVIQTHLAEAVAECQRVGELFPNDASYAAVYDRHGLLTPRTLLAHCLHLSDEEWRLIARRGSVVVHCPGANTFLGSGLFDLRKAREHGVRLALGSDVAAGPDVAMPRVARAMIEVAKLRRATVDPSLEPPTPAEAWRLITEGNAEALGWNDAGRIAVGAAADLLILHVPFEPDAHLIGRLIYGWRDVFIAHRVVAGQLID